ncbi:MAG: NADH-quinone oxidoreductase subunit N, partial [Ilumatobacteraceae bacterium]
AVIAAYLYLRIMVSMWLSEPRADAPVASMPYELSMSSRITLGLAVAITLVLGILPTWLLDVGDSLSSFAR